MNVIDKEDDVNVNQTKMWHEYEAKKSFLGTIIKNVRVRCYDEILCV